MVDDPKKNSYQVLRVDTRLPWQIRATSASWLLSSDFRLLIMIYDMTVIFIKLGKESYIKQLNFTGNLILTLSWIYNRES